MKEPPTYLHATGGGTYLDVFVQPRAARSGIAGVHGRALKLKVRAPAQDDKANRAVLELLAEILGVPVRNLEIVSGHKSRSKRILLLDATPATVAERLEAATRGA